MPPHELTSDNGSILAPAVVPDDAVARLQQSDVVVLGRMPHASNGTFLARLDRTDDNGQDTGGDGPDTGGDEEPWGLAIYKPTRGERPLWDFEPGLHRREVAAYVLSDATGLGVVPPTVARNDLPLGEGSLQWFVAADFAHHYFSMFETRPDLVDQLQAIAVLDVLANNTDRKSGHCLLEERPEGDRVWGIDNGLCFAVEDKLRTVIWEFGGDPLPDPLIEVVTAVADEVPPALLELLQPDEVAAVGARARRLAARPVFPVDHSGRAYPWPLI